jgi:hypothetical protein
MGNYQTIQRSIEELPAADRARLRDWLVELEELRFDAQIEQDAAAGRLDALADAALVEHRAGLTRPR